VDTASLSRRTLLSSLTAGVFVATPNWSLADELTRTPRVGEGPFYPDKLPLDTDNDLLVVNNQLTSAVGTIAYVSGRVLDSRGDPIRDALVEIWQCDCHGIYIHSRSASQGGRDENFQGFGRFLTGSTGEYLFRTIQPVPYTGRPAAHIHVKIKKHGKQLLTTEIYVNGLPGNDLDPIRKGISSDKGRAAVTVPFTKIRDARAGEVAAHCDLVLPPDALKNG